MVTAAKKASNAKWDKANMQILACKVRKDYAERVKAAAAANGDTINGIIKRALDDYLEQGK